MAWLRAVGQWNNRYPGNSSLHPSQAPLCLQCASSLCTPMTPVRLCLQWFLHYCASKFSRTSMYFCEPSFSIHSCFWVPVSPSITPVSTGIPEQPASSGDFTSLYDSSDHGASSAILWLQCAMSTSVATVSPHSLRYTPVFAPSELFHCQWIQTTVHDRCSISRDLNAVLADHRWVVGSLNVGGWGDHFGIS